MEDLSWDRYTVQPVHCDRCGHGKDRHFGAGCATCDDLAQTGQYAPCTPIPPKRVS